MRALEHVLAGVGWRLDEPAVLAALLALVAAAAAFGVAGIVRRRALLRRAFGDLAGRVAPSAAPGRRGARLALAASGLALLAIGAARPQAGALEEEAPVRGVDLAVLVDASRSMRARDATPDRLERARLAVARLLERLPAARVAVVAFAGDAELVSPLTSDHAAAMLLLGAVDPAAMPAQGTEVARALEAALRALAPAGDRGAARAVLLLSDGEDHGRGAAEAAERLALAGIPVFTAGVGSDRGAPVPDGRGSVVADALGRPVSSSLDEPALAELAARGGGRHVRLGDASEGEDELARALARLERSAPGTARVRSWGERFPRFAAAGLALLAAASLLPEASRRGRAARGAAARATAAAAALLLTGAAPFLGEHAGLAEANALAARDPEAALRIIDAIEREVGPRAELDVNRGLALFRAGRVAEARRSFALSVRAPGPLASRGMYADGVAAMAEGDEQAAIAAWRRALVLDPANGAARFNLEVLLRRMAEGAAQGPAGDGSAEGVEADSGAPQGGDGAAAGSARDPREDADAGDASGARAEGARRPPTAAELVGALAPMSAAEAERLLDGAARDERVLSMRPPRGTRPPADRPW